jgi:hypothetical protein
VVLIFVPVFLLVKKGAIFSAPEDNTSFAVFVHYRFYGLKHKRPSLNLDCDLPLNLIVKANAKQAGSSLKGKEFNRSRDAALRVEEAVGNYLRGD